MFFTRSLSAVLLTSLVAGAAYAESKVVEKTLNITATIPVMQPKLELTKTGPMIMNFNVAEDKLEEQTTTFRATGNSGLSIYLKDAPELTHTKSIDLKIPLKVLVKLDGKKDISEEISNGDKKKVTLRRNNDNFKVTDAVAGTLVIKPAKEVHIAGTRTGEYKGNITVIVEANDDDDIATL